ncbi:MAG: CapA family protein [Lachnospiraceae bacterium]|nr:CapA family protein [Lachnospiraceae bacterium]
MKTKPIKILAILLPVLLLIMIVLIIISMVLNSKKSGTIVASSELESSSEITGEGLNSETETIVPKETEISSEFETEEATEETPSYTPQSATLVFTGDILLGDRTLPLYQSSGIDGILSDDLQALMQDADICMVNEEFPFSTRGTKAEDKQFTFRTDPVYVSAFNDMGIDIVTLANNHVLDFGAEALLDTFDTLDQAGILYAGAGANAARAMEPQYIEANGINFGFLAASRVWPLASWEATDTNPGCFGTYDPAKLVAAIEAAETQCDFLTVYVHWGIERQNYPEDYQVNMAKMYIDAGADLVIGAHPHCLQGIEYFDGKPVFYSLGNYIFGQTTDKTAAIKVNITETEDSTEAIKDLSASYEVIPATAQNAKTSQTYGDEANALFSYLTEISYGASVDVNGIVTDIE